LAYLIISNNIPVRLRLLLPIVENAIGSSALRPGDVIRARNGKTTEVTNTDAEGRLILADALTYACESSGDFPQLSEKPRLIIDFATLTGAARVALGDELPALFSNHTGAMTELWNMSQEVSDPLWPLPLWVNYKKGIKNSSVADLVNSVEG
jgi:leucyl aminopeptidase